MNNFVFRPVSTHAVKTAQKRTTAKPGPAATPATLEALVRPQASHDDIARRAYDIYVKAGSKRGHCKQNWLQAEKELRQPTAGPGPLNTTEVSPAGRPGLEPVVNTVAGAAPAFLGGKGLTGGGTSPMVQGGRKNRV